jgi:NADPH-dependent 2,4-dienoyl-CoA reductase/sulfur reductase-like enzyme/nitrite reductase/ring-hydroxylating ferredoxin subunit
MAVHAGPAGPDLAEGVEVVDVPEEGCIAGHVGDQPVLLSRFSGRWSAVGGACTHYGGNLADGLVTGDIVHCPLHHACFSLRTGEALAAPAFDALKRWQVIVEGGRVRVTGEAAEPQRPPPRRAAGSLDHIVIVGGGAAGFAAAEMLRRRGYANRLTILSADEHLPYDRPNLSKDYLAGTAPEEWIPLRDEGFYQDHGIDVRTGAHVTSLSSTRNSLTLQDGAEVAFDRLLLATGAEPVRLALPGAGLPHVHVLRSLQDARAIIAAAAGVGRVAVIGASFIGLEAAAALRARQIEVHVVAPEATPMERVLGREVGEYIRALHERQGVVFHLGTGVAAISGDGLQLTDGGRLTAGLVIVGVGVRPRVELAVAAGLTVDDGVVVDGAFRTSRDGVFAAGDIARYHDPHSAAPVRVEHWVAAQRQGQAAALAMLGEAVAAPAPPFFWSQHYDKTIRYVGAGRGFDRHEVDGSLDAEDATVRYFRGGRLVAAASLGRDRENLQIEADLAGPIAEAPVDAVVGS